MGRVQPAGDSEVNRRYRSVTDKPFFREETEIRENTCNSFIYSSYSHFEPFLEHFGVDFT